MKPDLEAKLKEAERVSKEIEEIDSLSADLKSCKRVSKKMNNRFIAILTGDNK